MAVDLIMTVDAQRNNPPSSESITRSTPLNMPLDALDLDAVRRGFGALFDDTGRAACQQGYDLDDLLVTRWLELAWANDTRCRVSAEWLSDRDALLRHVRRELEAETGTRPDPADVCVIGLTVTAVVDRGPS